VVIGVAIWEIYNPPLKLPLPAVEPRL